jgi:methylated-DNA-[protein]-cysteine S-methyltransferase
MRNGSRLAVARAGARTKIGRIAVFASGRGVAMVLLPGVGADEVRGRMERLGLVESPGELALASRAAAQIAEYVLVARRAFDVPLDLSFLSPFARDVLRALARVPFGGTITYGELAVRAGHADAARAVGSVMRLNPVPIIVPCHRVLSASGALGGWSGPPGMKERLLALEGVRIV